jgi:D-alanyl-D-alanine dipeptidase
MLRTNILNKPKSLAKVQNLNTNLYPVFLKTALEILMIIGVVIMLQACEHHKKITLIADPEVLSIPIYDNKEPLINLRKQKVIQFGPSPEIPNNTDYTKVRKSVYEKLVKAQALLPKGLKFRIYEGFRSLDLQDQLFKGRFEKVQRAYPDWSYAELFRETTRLVSPVINLDGSHNIPPHSTGAAIDIYLVDKTGKAVDMGIHPKDWMDDKDGLISETESVHISDKARMYRQIMSKVLTQVGFVNYPTEYWHWSYGDRYWAYITNSKKAIYGIVRE